MVELPGWRDPPYRNYSHPLIVYTVASIACFAGSYYAFQADEKKHPWAGFWAIILLLFGFTSLAAALGPWWIGATP
jgi:hypothetical protein